VDAAAALQGLMAMGGVENFKHVGRVRLAKILLYQDKAEEVLTLLDGQDNAAFAARYAEARGDAYVALGRSADARKSYEAALQEQVPTIDQGLVQLKMLDLPEDAVTIDAAIEVGDVETVDEEAATPDDALEDGNE
jgi:predicted negative regulator of RcsB-dependent stress response